MKLSQVYQPHAQPTELGEMKQPLRMDDPRSVINKKEKSYMINIHLAQFYSQDEGPLNYGIKLYSHTLILIRKMPKEITVTSEPFVKEI